MMDLSNFTISPDLFYSKTPNELWKPKSLQKITPAQITKSVKKTKQDRPIIHRRNVHKKSKNKTVSPQLGRLHKLKRFSLKKLIKKKLNLGSKKTEPVNKENNNTINVSATVKPTTIQQQKAIAKTIQRQEEEISKKRYFQPPKSMIAKRAKGSSYKLFKSKNVREETESSSESDDDLVPEIRDFDHSGISIGQSPPKKSTASILLDPVPFEDEDIEQPELVSTNVIESLLQNLDGEADESSSETPKASELSSLDGLIETLEGGTIEKATEKVKQKAKVMGMGTNQMQIDAGQKKFGLVECKDCGFSYNVSYSSICCAKSL